MVHEVYMPKFGMSMVEGEIAKWLVKEGDKINKGDEIVEIAENKAVHTVEALVSGTLEKILVEEGEVAGVGEPIAVIVE
ncbi:MAG TPA: biotin/lipoyl-binding protein [Tissierellia bacterium]|nr:biotin/lipoyl-binding protein [Tissierellia bacterium]